MAAAFRGRSSGRSSSFQRTKAGTRPAAPRAAASCRRCRSRPAAQAEFCASAASGAAAAAAAVPVAWFLAVGPPVNTSPCVGHARTAASRSAAAFSRAAPSFLSGRAFLRGTSVSRPRRARGCAAPAAAGVGATGDPGRRASPDRCCRLRVGARATDTGSEGVLGNARLRNRHARAPHRQRMNAAAFAAQFACGGRTSRALPGAACPATECVDVLERGQGRRRQQREWRGLCPAFSV
eukprot:364724-Chlamydomonas_euryale.AAC.7